MKKVKPNAGGNAGQPEPQQPEPRPYFGRQEPEFGEGGGFGRHEDLPHYGQFGGQVGGRGPVERSTAIETNDEAKSRMDRPQHKNPAQHGPGGKYEGGESTGGYADHQTKK